jgi:hypothetical protein
MHRIKSREGLIATRMLIDVMRTAAVLFFMEDHAASLSDELMICFALFVGQAEGRLLTAGKTATYIGMPRPTVVRKMRALQARGLVDQAAKRTYRLAIDRDDVAKRLNAAVDACTKHIHRASSDLSRLDTRAIARRKADK